MKRYLLACVFCVVAATAQAQLIVGPLDHRLLGAANGVAELDNAGKVPLFELPFSSTSLLSLPNIWSGAQSLTAGSIDGMPIGTATPSTGKFTTLSTTGAVNFGGSLAAAAISNTPISGSTGAFTTLTVSGTSSLAALTASSLDAAPIGAFIPAAGVFTTLTVTGLVNFDSNLSAAAINATPIGSTTPASGVFTNLSADTATFANLSMAALNAIPIGTSTPAAGAFTSLTASGLVNFTGNLTAAAMDSTPIGATTPSSGAFTVLAVSGNATFRSLTATTINTTPVGNITPSSGAFTTLTSTDTATLASLNATPIGTTIPASGTFTTVRMARRTILTGATDTATVNDYVLAWKSSTASAKTETLPTCGLTNDGMVLVIKDVTGDAATNPITLSASPDTIDLNATWVITAAKGSITVQCDGSQTNWMIE